MFLFRTADCPGDHRDWAAGARKSGSFCRNPHKHLRPLSAELGALARIYHLPCQVAETDAIWFSPGSAGFLSNSYKMLKSKLDRLVIR